MKLQRGRETEQKTANEQMPRTVGVVQACQPHFTHCYARPDKVCKYSDLNDEPDSDETNYCNIESQAYEKLFEFI